MSVTYDKNVDYAAKINAARAAGNTAAADAYTAQREAKMLGEGLDNSGNKLPAATTSGNSNTGSTGSSGKANNSTPTATVTKPVAAATVTKPVVSTPAAAPEYDTGVQALIDAYNSTKAAKTGAAATSATPITVKADSTGSAPSTAKVGDIVHTNGGDYEIKLPGTPGAVLNHATGLYSIKVNNSATTSSSTPDWLNTASNAANPAGVVSAAVTTTKYVDPNGNTKTGYIKDGHTYQDSACTTPIAVGSTVTTGGGTYTMTANGGTSVDMAGVTKTTYMDPNNSEKVGYIKDGLTYTDAACTNRIPTGSTVTTADGKTYTMQDTGGTAVIPPVVVSKDPTINDFANQIVTAMNSALEADPTLTKEQAYALACQQLDPQYNDSMDTAMNTIQNKALQTGFFGQLPTVALQQETAGKLESSKLQAINALADQLFGESSDAANTKLTAAQTEQQNKIANLLSLLGVAQSENSYASDRADSAWEKAYKEAALAKTGSSS